MYDISKSEQVKHELTELIKKHIKDDVPTETIGKLSNLTPEQTEKVIHNIAKLIEEYIDKENE